MKLLLLAGLATVVLVGSAVVPTSASAGIELDSYCNPTGDYCYRITEKREDQVWKFAEIQTTYHGPVTICVDPPERLNKSCTRSRIRQGYGLPNEYRLGLPTSYGLTGRWSVEWKIDGRSLGPPLHFTTDPHRVAEDG